MDGEAILHGSYIAGNHCSHSLYSNEKNL